VKTARERLDIQVTRAMDAALGGQASAQGPDQVNRASARQVVWRCGHCHEWSAGRWRLIRYVSLISDSVRSTGP
jgi:hypothetical protein